MGRGCLGKARERIVNDAPRLLGIVLCGGRSSRMGSDKWRLRLPNGNSFLQHALERVAQVCDLVGVSSHDHVETAFHVIKDPVEFRGPVVGIAASLRFARQNSLQGCMFTPIDMPALRTSDLLRIKQVWQDSGRLTIATANRLQPLVGVYPVALLREIEQLAASDDRSLTNWIRLQNHETVRLTEAVCRNINTPEDLSDAP